MHLIKDIVYISVMFSMSDFGPLTCSGDAHRRSSVNICCAAKAEWGRLSLDPE